jgi:hypothetical protein
VVASSHIFFFWRHATPCHAKRGRDASDEKRTEWCGRPSIHHELNAEPWKTTWRRFTCNHRLRVRDADASGGDPRTSAESSATNRTEPESDGEAEAKAANCRAPGMPRAVLGLVATSSRWRVCDACGRRWFAGVRADARRRRVRVPPGVRCGGCVQYPPSPARQHPIGIRQELLPPSCPFGPWAASAHSFLSFAAIYYYE